MLSQPMNGFTDDQIIELRKGTASFDTKLDALVKFTASVVENKGNATQESKDAFFAAGYNEANMIDLVMVVGDKIIRRRVLLIKERSDASTLAVS